MADLANRDHREFGPVAVKETISAAPASAKPLFRGYLHLTVALMAPGALVHLLVVADSASAYAGGSIFGASLILLYSASALRHVVRWSPRRDVVVRRIDHAMAFVLIGGTYTPFALAALGLAWGIPLLSVVWGLAGAGIIVAVAWPAAPRWLRAGIYTGLGWLAIVAAPQLSAALPAKGFVLIILGGVTYSLGAAIYAKQWPNPYPRYFGFHEVFHTFVVAGTAIFYSVIVIYVLPN